VARENRATTLSTTKTKKNKKKEIEKQQQLIIINAQLRLNQQHFIWAHSGMVET